MASPQVLPELEYHGLKIVPTLKPDGTWAGGAKTEWRGLEIRLAGNGIMFQRPLAAAKKSHAMGSPAQYLSKLADLVVGLEKYIEKHS